MKNSGIALLPKSPCGRDDDRVKAALKYFSEVSPRGQPPVKKSVLRSGDATAEAQSLKNVVPHFPSINALSEDVLRIVLILETCEAGRRSILESMSESPVRSPNPVLNCQPNEEFALQESPASPNVSGKGGSFSALAKTIVGGLCSVRS